MELAGFADAVRCLLGVASSNDRPIETPKKDKGNANKFILQKFSISHTHHLFNVSLVAQF